MPAQLLLGCKAYHSYTKEDVRKLHHSILPPRFHLFVQRKLDSLVMGSYNSAQGIFCSSLGQPAWPLLATLAGKSMARRFKGISTCTSCRSSASTFFGLCLVEVHRPNFIWLRTNNRHLGNNPLRVARDRGRVWNRSVTSFGLVTTYWLSVSFIANELRVTIIIPLAISRRNFIFCRLYNMW